jgi:hypothetical protein
MSLGAPEPEKTRANPEKPSSIALKFPLLPSKPVEIESDFAREFRLAEERCRALQAAERSVDRAIEEKKRVSDDREDSTRGFRHKIRCKLGACVDATRPNWDAANAARLKKRKKRAKEAKSMDENNRSCVCGHARWRHKSKYEMITCEDCSCDNFEEAV